MSQNEAAVRWGVIGLGGVVVQQIAPAIVNSAHSKLAGCAGSSAAKTRAFAREVRGGPGVLASGDDGIRAIEIASAVLASIQSRRSVAIAS